MVETPKFNIIFLPLGPPSFLLLFVFLLLILIHRARSCYNDDGRLLSSLASALQFYYGPLFFLYFCYRFEPVFEPKHMSQLVFVY